MTTPQNPAITIRAVPANAPAPDLYSSYEVDVHGKKHIITFIPTGSTKPALLAKPVWEQMGSVYLTAIDKLRTAAQPQQIQEPEQQIKSIDINTTTGISYTYIDPAKASQLPTVLNLQQAPEIQTAFQNANALISQAFTDHQRVLLSDNGTNGEEYKSSNKGCLKPEESHPSTPQTPVPPSTPPNTHKPTALPPEAPIGLRQSNNNCWANSVLQMICASNQLKQHIYCEDNPVLCPHGSQLAPIAKLVRAYEAAQTDPQKRNQTPQSIDTNIMRDVLHKLKSRTSSINYLDSTQVDATEALHVIVQHLHTVTSRQIDAPILQRSATTSHNPFLQIPASEATMDAGLRSLHHGLTTSTSFTDPPAFLPIVFTRTPATLLQECPAKERIELPHEMVLGSQKDDTYIYQLVSVLKHAGEEPTRGHWTSLVINRDNPRETKYFICDDNDVKEISQQDAQDFMRHGTTFLYELEDANSSRPPLPLVPQRRHSLPPPLKHAGTGPSSRSRRGSVGSMPHHRTAAAAAASEESPLIPPVPRAHIEEVESKRSEKKMPLPASSSSSLSSSSANDPVLLAPPTNPQAMVSNTQTSTLPILTSSSVCLPYQIPQPSHPYTPPPASSVAPRSFAAASSAPAPTGSILPLPSSFSPFGPTSASSSSSSSSQPHPLPRYPHPYTQSPIFPIPPTPHTAASPTPAPTGSTLPFSSSGSHSTSSSRSASSSNANAPVLLPHSTNPFDEDLGQGLTGLLASTPFALPGSHVSTPMPSQVEDYSEYHDANGTPEEDLLSIPRPSSSTSSSLTLTPKTRPPGYRVGTRKHSHPTPVGVNQQPSSTSTAAPQGTLYTTAHPPYSFPISTSTSSSPAPSPTTPQSPSLFSRMRTFWKRKTS